MAQQKMQERRRTLVEAAISVFAERGFWDTPTLLISRTAGVAEGTLFNYFTTKDDLINAVYLAIKQELAETLFDGLIGTRPLQEQARHIWHRYIAWGLTHTEKFKVLNQIGDSYQLNDEVRAASEELFAGLTRMVRESIERGAIRDYPVEYLAASMVHLADMTITFLSKNQGQQVDYEDIGFELWWSGITP
jgi:AcrR family transcriptional regulator